MLRFCKLGQLRGLLGAAALLLASSTAQAETKATETTASSLFRWTANSLIAIPSLVLEKTYQVVFHGSTGWHREKFFELVEAAGYELKKADTTAGLIPEIKLVYEQARELSEGDREELEKEIRKFEEEDPTWLEGRLEARILRFLLSASEAGDYRIDEFDIALLPLPGFSFTSKPLEFSYTVDTMLLMRRLNEMRIKQEDASLSKKN